MSLKGILIRRRLHLRFVKPLRISHKFKGEDELGRVLQGSMTEHHNAFSLLLLAYQVLDGGACFACIGIVRISWLSTVYNVGIGACKVLMTCAYASFCDVSWPKSNDGCCTYPNL